MRTVADVANINITVPDDLHRRAKAEAAMRGQSLKDFIIEALAAAVEKKGGKR